MLFCTGASRTPRRTVFVSNASGVGQPAITLRPKVAQLIQFPVPLQNSLQALYGVGLLVPEFLLVMSGVMWMRSRTA